MKLKVAKEQILKGLQITQGVIGTRSTLPILSNVLIETDGDRLWLTSTDLEVSVRCSIAAEIETAGSTTLPAKKLFSIIRELPASELSMEVDEKNSASLTCGSSFFKILGLPREEFPSLPKQDDGFAYTLDQAVLKDMLSKTAYAASSDETRQFLNGVLLSFKNDKLTAVATDGRRLALIEHEMEFPKDAEGDMIVPSKAVNELLHSLGNEGQIKIRAVKNQVTFEFGDQVLFSKLIEGNYPNFRQVIPSQAEHRIPIERETLLAAVRRVALLTSDRSNSIKLTFAKNKVEVSAQTQDIGEAHESIPVKFTGAELNVAFNPEFILDPLRHLTSDEVYLEFNDELSPGVIKCDTPFLYVLMPMRIG
jgi:DNA polymerase-3 subunit beta